MKDIAGKKKLRFVLEVLLHFMLPGNNKKRIACVVRSLARQCDHSPPVLLFTFQKALSFLPLIGIKAASTIKDTDQRFQQQR